MIKNGNLQYTIGETTRSSTVVRPPNPQSSKGIAEHAWDMHGRPTAPELLVRQANAIDSYHCSVLFIALHF